MALRGEAIECVEEGLRFLGVVLGRISGVSTPTPPFFKGYSNNKGGKRKENLFHY